MRLSFQNSSSCSRITHHRTRNTRNGPGSCRRRERSEEGIALIVVMIAIFVLSMLAWQFAGRMKVETTLARNANNEAELEWIGRSGVEYCRWILGQDGQCAPYDGPNQIWAGGTSDPCATNGGLAEVEHEVHLGHGSFTWKITDLESKWNINTTLAPGGDKTLDQAFIVMGMDAGQLPELTGAILDWMDPDDHEHLGGGAENDYYHAQNPPYDCKNGPIDDLSELLFVRGITPEIYWGGASTNHQSGIVQQSMARNGQPAAPVVFPYGLVDFFTPISSGRININTASAEVLQLIQGVDPTIAQAIVAGRQGEDDGSGMLGPYPTVDAVRRLPELNPLVINVLRQYCVTFSTNFRIEIDAKIDKYTRQFVAIVHRTDRRNPRDIQILNFYWK
jgi:general secretion pathway protein K